MVSNDDWSDWRISYYRLILNFCHLSVESVPTSSTRRAVCLDAHIPFEEVRLDRGVWKVTNLFTKLGVLDRQDWIVKLDLPLMWSFLFLLTYFNGFLQVCHLWINHLLLLQSHDFWYSWWLNLGTWLKVYAVSIVIALSASVLTCEPFLLS